MKQVVQQTLKAEIKRHGFKTQEEFAWTAGIRPCVLSDILHGHRRLSEIYALKIRRAFDHGPQKGEEIHHDK